ncbi:MAG: hypothetical protein JWO79_1510 [Actinomycetia bacterium]|nr:hypothetical protein [Actinomycetes bacterium]
MPGRRIALVVATDRYHDQRLRRLRAPSRDAKELAAVLADPAIGGFEVSVLHNEPEHVVRRRIDAVLADRAPGDTILLHIACHGVKDEDGHLYLATADTELGHLASTAVPAQFLCARMDHSRSRQIMLFLDCCYSGAISRDMLARGDNTVHVRDAFAGDGRGRVIVTASSALEYAFEGGEIAGTPRGSVFTSAMIRGMRTGEADLDGDGYVTVDEMYSYLYEAVRAQTPWQTPNKWDFVQGPIMLARSPAGPRPGELDRDVAFRPDPQLAPTHRHLRPVPAPVDERLLDAALASRSDRAVRAARRSYEQAAASDDPEVAARAALLLARLARHLGDTETAITWYRRGWAQGRTAAHATLAVELAGVLAATGERADAGWFYRWVLDTGPSAEAAAAAIGLGDVLEDDGQERDAQALYRRATAMVPMSDPVWPLALCRLRVSDRRGRTAVMASWLGWLEAGHGEWVTFGDAAAPTRSVEVTREDGGALAIRVGGYEPAPGGGRRLRGPAFVAALVGQGFRVDLRRSPGTDDLVRGGVWDKPEPLAAYTDDLLVRALGAGPGYTLEVSAQLGVA